MAEVIELVTFRTKPGVDNATFVAAVGQSTAYLEQQPGFIAREVGLTATGEWADIIRWSDLDAALRAAAAFNAAPETQSFYACIDRESVQMRHFRAVHWGGTRPTNPPGTP
jgi:hypothetical protein